jgi:hypothetical protein
MYKFFALISFIIRNFYLPNPFDSLQYGLIINMMIEPILHAITFAVVGLFYKRGSAPAWGSFLYLFFYAVHISLIMLCSVFNFTEVAIGIIIILYITLLLGLMTLRDKIEKRSF